MLKNNPKIKEIIRYFVVGVFTTVVSLGIYYGLVYTVLDPNHTVQLQVANVVSWIGSVLFAYVANRKFVFHSKNEHMLKEATSFVGSRIVTLVMDMAIMFVGVSYLKLSDKWMKLFSQVVIMILNYVFSKLFVFHSKKKEKKLKKKSKYLGTYFLYLLPFIDFTFYMIDNQYVTYFLIGLQSLYFLWFVVGIYRSKGGRWLLSFINIYMVIQLVYLYCQQFDVLKGYVFLLHLFLLPVAFLYFRKSENYRITKDSLFLLFLMYSVLFLIPFSLKIHLNYAFYRRIIAILLLLLPLVVKMLYEHKNYLIKIFGFSLILAMILLWKSKAFALCFVISLFCVSFVSKREWKVLILLFFASLGTLIYVFAPDVTILQNENYESFFFDNRFEVLEENHKVFLNANIEEQLFGIYSVEDLELQRVQMDIPDIFYELGFVGFGVFLLVMVCVFFSLKVKMVYLIGIFFVVLVSFFCGGVFFNGSLGILFGMIMCASKKDDKKRILLVSNMYPSKKYKHYGSFVKNCSEMLEELGYQVDKSVMKKHDLFLVKICSYFKFYCKTFVQSIFYSYDYYYVHFVSHSTYPVLLGKKSGKTKLICNVHGNDIVADYDFEQKNVRRASFVLPFADKIVCPSTYFEEILQNNYHIEKDKIVIFPSGGVNLEVFQPLDREKCLEDLWLDTNYIYYGMVSRVEKDKGWDTLLQAIYELKEQKGLQNIKLLVVGTGQEQAEFDKMVLQYHLKDIVIQKEFVLQKDLVKYYNSMDLFIFPTKRKSESLGLVGLEAMACGTFVLGCDLYGPKEYLKNHVNSLTFQNEKELVSKILDFQKMNARKKEHIKKRAMETAQGYGVGYMKEKLAEIFRSV